MTPENQPPIEADKSAQRPGAGDGDALFQSFWMGGFEGADHINSHGQPLCLRQSNGHERQAASDYAALARFGIRTVRESVGWRAASTLNGQLDLGSTVRLASEAARQGVQVIWTLHHYGHPPDVDFFADDFPVRFADFCAQTARALKNFGDRPPVFQPMNEISFLAWAAGTTHLIHPYRAGSIARSHELKCRLVKATLAGCDAIWSEAPNARIVHTDPMIHVAPATEDAAHVAAASGLTNAQFQAWDMLAGRSEPGLGGAPRYLDILGINYYHSNQWLHPGDARLFWHQGDLRRRPLQALLSEAWQRYQRPLFLAETGHVGDGRAPWLDDIAEAALHCQAEGVPLGGVCLYPLVDRPDWEHPDRWHRSGLWDVPNRASPTPATPAAAFGRTLHSPLAERLLHWRQHVPAPDAFSAAERLTLPKAHPHPAADASFTHSSGTPITPLIVFSHLRWDFVYQRPQQLLSRLAKRHPVVFVEEPVPAARHPVLERLQPCSGVEVLRPHVTGAAPGFHDDHIPQVQALLADYLKSRALNRYWLWFYTPMALPFAAELAPEGTVYDCMDELAAFRHAPRQLLQRENALFKQADLVFTGGQSLYESKRARHPRVHCLPSSVDAAHFAGGGADGFEPAAQTSITGPRIGYFGVIDERIDIPLISHLASAHPDWQIVMVGPVVKIDPDSLPRADNIHWLGQQDYQDLPAFIAGWDVCLLPFALNEATRFISPTKTLEYMAAGKPIVSTPIRDVVTPYSEIVHIAGSPAAFVQACEAALASPADAAERVRSARASVLAGTSWDRTAARMEDLIAARALERAVLAPRVDVAAESLGEPPAAAVG